MFGNLSFSRCVDIGANLDSTAKETLESEQDIT